MKQLCVVSDSFYGLWLLKCSYLIFFWAFTPKIVHSAWFFLHSSVWLPNGDVKLTDHLHFKEVVDDIEDNHLSDASASALIYLYAEYSN